MVEALLDTATVVDLLREYPPAAVWITEKDQTLGVTKFVWMEIVEGSHSKQSLRLFHCRHSISSANTPVHTQFKALDAASW
ncbi:MAG: hypothetical protein OHK0046_01220 [Anaerolineae bacterium]